MRANLAPDGNRMEVGRLELWVMAIKLRRRPLAEQRDIYQAKLVWAVAALQRITWHIGCSKVKRGDLTLSGPNGPIDLSASCPACIAEAALAQIAGGGPYVEP